MSRDSFEEMQRRNPVTSDELPPAPMSVADRILGRGAARAMPGWLMAAAAMVVVATVGGGMLLWLGDRDPAPVGGSATTSTSATSIVGPGCSGLLADGDLTEQPGLPEAVAARRAAIWMAAVTCDWDSLERLLGSSFGYSYGGQDPAADAPIRHWQDLEDAGDEPIRFLAELLDRPFGTLDGGDGPEFFVWPSVHATSWEDATDEEREALRPLYGDADFADFEAFGGYFGYRIGITADGEWVYFLVGD